MKSKNILIGAFIGLLILMHFGCSSTPAQSAGMDLDTAIREAATQMEARISSGTMVALVSVASPSTAFSTQVLTRLESAIVSNGKLIVVDRANLDKIREEQGFQLSGEVSDESATRIGQLLGAGAIVTGSLTDLGDVYSLTLKAINIETATVAVSYIADLAKTTRIQTLLASRDGASAGGTTQARTTTSATSPTTTLAPRQFTVTFNSNGASGIAPTAQTVQNGESITIPDVGTMTNARGTFGGWNTSANGTGTQYVVGDSLVVVANIQLYARWIEKVFNIGDTGPAGGIIFYDKFNSSGGWRYLEAAPVLTEQTMEWGLYHRPELGNTQTGIGAGKQNTIQIASELRIRNELGRAAEFCNLLEYGGYRDWYLPSKDELNLMYQNLKTKGLGSFRNEFYWSSSENGWAYAWYQNFSNGEQGAGIGYPFTGGTQKNNSLRVRPIRQF